MQETVDLFRQFPEMRRDNAGLQEFSVLLDENRRPNVRLGFLSYYNKTTGEIVPSCDRLFTLRNAQVLYFVLISKKVLIILGCLS